MQTPRIHAPGPLPPQLVEAITASELVREPHVRAPLLDHLTLGHAASRASCPSTLTQRSADSTPDANAIVTASRASSPAIL
jgi:hypothetical protein